MMCHARLFDADLQLLLPDPPTRHHHSPLTRRANQLPRRLKRIRAQLSQYQPAYVVTALAYSRVQIEAMRSGIAMSSFQASQQASTMSS